MKADILCKETIDKYLKTKNPNITVLPTVDSTNRFLKSVSNENTPEYTVVIAENQTAGRGRFTRKFHSPSESGIYMSILLKPQFNANAAVLITAAAAVAVSDAIEALSQKNTQIKWVNDVLIDNKKICGILCEGALNIQSGRLDRVILGIGINAYKPKNDFDSEIKNIAGAVFDDTLPDMRNKLIAEIINRFSEYYAELENRTFLEKFRNRSAVTGKKITVLRGDSARNAVALEIDDECRLLVEYEDGLYEYLSSGEVSLRI